MYRRIITTAIEAALGDSPIVLLNGARQTGKTTLVQALQAQALQETRTYLTFDEAGVLSAAKDDPAGFLAGLSGPVTLDEVQHVPELFPALKAVVDRTRTPGRFLLTGSANILLLPRLSESLAGRMEILTLWPLAQAETEGYDGENLIDRLFSERWAFGPLPEISRADLIRRVLLGGYPEPMTRSSEARRRAWFGSYLTTILQRDIRDMANIEGLTALPRLLSLLASRSGTLLNLADISRTSGLAYTTLTRYMTLLEAAFLVQSLPAWSANLAKRMVKSPKMLLCDTGLAASQLGLTADRLAADGSLFGQLLETFAAMELRKIAGGSAEAIQFFHSRTQSGEEVDVLLEDGAGRIVGVEVKASASVAASDFKGLRGMAETVRERFVRGLVLYAGSQIIPFGKRLHAVPFSLLWH